MAQGSSSDAHSRDPVAQPSYACFAGFFSESSFPPTVDKKIEPRLTGPVSGGVLFKVIRRAQNPPATLRGGFLL